MPPEPDPDTRFVSSAPNLTMRLPHGRMAGLGSEAWVTAILLLVTVVTYLNAPRQGDFAWSEAPRNALNGAFVLDFFKAWPLNDPYGWAEAYYLQYPALTILFYPPAFFGLLAIAYALFSVSHATAVGTVTVCFFALALGIYRVVRLWASSSAALAAALLFMAAPEVQIWAQQVMLEIPMLAAATWAGYWLLRHRDSGRVREGSLALLCTLLAIYTKQTALIIVASFGLTLLLWRGKNLLSDAAARRGAILLGLGSIPLGILQYRFARFNLTSVVNREDVAIPRGSLEELGWYAVHLPTTAGIPMTALAAIFLAGFALQVWGDPGRIRRLPTTLIVAWWVVAYVALTLIHLKETRHGLLLLVPMAMAAGLAGESLRRWCSADRWILVLAAATMIHTALTVRAPRVAGYRGAAAYIARIAPAGGRVLFSGNHDGTFIFNVRAQTERPDLSVVRADKLFLDIRVMPGLGLNPKPMSAEEIADKLCRLGISYVVAVPGQWREAPVMAEFQRVLDSPRFSEVARLPVSGNAEEKELVVYRNEGGLRDPPEPIEASVSMTGTKLGRPRPVP